MVIHFHKGQPILYENGLLEFKGHSVPLKEIEENLHREKTILSNKLTMTIINHFLTIDCLTLPLMTVKKLISKCQN